MKVTNLFTEKDREVFDRIDRDCIAMHVPTPPKTFLKLDVVGPDGEPIERYEDRAHSWVRNAYNLLMYRLSGANEGVAGYGAGSLRVKRQTAALTRPSDVGIINTSSIFVGSGTGGEDFETFALTSAIADGTASGQLVYSTGTISYAYDAGTKKITTTLTKLFNNNSGASIDVTEVSLDTTVQSVLICRDLLASAVTVPNAGQLTVTYTIEMTFPA